MPDTESPDRRRFLQECAGVAAAAAIMGVSGCASRSGFEDWASLARACDGRDEDRLWQRVRGQFDLVPDYAYFNAGGLGPSPRPVTETCGRVAADLERLCETGHERIPAVRRSLSAFLGCDENEMAITHNTTEGMNLVARGLSLRTDDEVVLTTHEHPGGAMPWLAMEKDRGIRVQLVEPGDGADDTLARIAAALTTRTRVVAVSHVLCTTGQRLPAREIAQLCRAAGVISVLDGAQAVGMIPVHLHDLGCDFYVASGHKWLLGPKGTGLLYIRAGARELWRPTLVGAWSDQCYDLDGHVLELRTEAAVVECGTRNTALACGLGAAVEFLRALGMERVARRGRTLAAHLRQRLHALPALRILTPSDVASSASIVTVTAKDDSVDIRTWAQPLRERYRIRTRPVSEHGLRALRVCTHICNTHAQIDRLAAALSEMSTA